MPRPKNQTPKARLHSSGQARVTIDGKDYLLGLFGSPEAERAYRRIITEWEDQTGRFAPTEEDPITIEEVAAAYWIFAEKYYGFDKNPHRGDCANVKAIIGILKRKYADLPAAQFSSLDLEAVQEEMVRLKWARSYINHSIGRLKRIFKWAGKKKLIPASVWAELLTVEGLKKGRSEAKEKPRVKPIDLDTVEATKVHLRPALRALIDFTLLTGCRPNEACQLRPIDIDKSNPDCWIFTPGKHKTEHHDHDRLVLIGPRAQAAIVFFLAGCDPEDYVFSPCREELRRLEDRRKNRKSPHTPSSLSRYERAAMRIRKRHPKQHYTTGSLRTAIHRACEKAGIDPVWGPNRLRHTAATMFRKSGGLDTTATVLGHKNVQITEEYAEKDLEAAMKLIAKVG